MMIPPSDFYIELERIANQRGVNAYHLDSVGIWHLTQALGALMSEASEETWAASWYSGCEEIIPQLAKQGQIPYADTMLACAKWLGHWAKYQWDGTHEYYMPYVPKEDDAA